MAFCHSIFVPNSGDFVRYAHYELDRIPGRCEIVNYYLLLETSTGDEHG
jgi:hypothetical protein